MNLIYLVKRVADYKADDTGSSNYAYIGEFYADIGQGTIVVAGFSVFGVYILSALLALDPLHLLTSFAQFLFISSSYVNILNIYAFSNTHDVSWGKKGRHEDTESGQTQEGPGPVAIERRFTFSDQDPNIRSAATQRDKTPEARNKEYQEALARAIAEDEPGQNVQKNEPVKYAFYRTFETASDYEEYRPKATEEISQCDQENPPNMVNSSVTKFIDVDLDLPQSFESLQDLETKSGKQLKKLAFEIEMVPSGASVEFGVYHEGKRIGSSGMGNITGDE
ncbi:hypothetical protein IL306_011898 [Fusarium sp. DS 682]|nr:hypothetical protein IL306_011898 [Fusarium sp. DS 682]